MIVGLNFDELEPGQWPLLKIERLIGLLFHQPSCPLVPLLGRQVPKMHFDPMRRTKWMDDLDRSLITHHKHGSKCLMAPTNGIDRTSESGFVEPPHLSRRKRHVIRRTLRSKTIHQPHTLLRIGKGKRLISGY